MRTNCSDRGVRLLVGLAPATTLAACRDSTDTQSASTTPVSEQTTVTTPDRQVVEHTFFTAASGNVGCLIDVDSVRCGIGDKDWSPPPRPADCEGDYGHNIALEPGGPPDFVCAGDSVLGQGDALPHGESIGAGPLRCDGAESSITCRDVESGQGFSMSRDAYELF
jgi:hypothetical protein